MRDATISDHAKRILEKYPEGIMSIANNDAQAQRRCGCCKMVRSIDSFITNGVHNRYCHKCQKGKKK